MAELVWDEVGKRYFETGIDRGVLYPAGTGAAAGTYPSGVAWNGLTGITETPSGAEANALYADNIKYLNMMSAEDLGLTIEAFTYPPEFGECDGSAEPTPGVSLGQQSRKSFGLSYRTKIGSDTDGNDHGYKIHLVYGCLASPSERPYKTVNDSPEANAMSWDVKTTPAPVTGYKPTALITVDSTKVDATQLAALEDLLYGTATGTAQLPLPDAVITLLTPAAG